MRTEWSDRNKTIQKLLGKEDTYKEGIDLLIEFRRELFIPKNFVNLFVPSCSSPLLSSGWNITIIAITPQFIIPVKIEFNIFKFNNPLIQVAIIKNAIPFINCQALEPFTIFIKQYNKNITITKSSIVVNKVNGLLLKF